MQHPSRNSSLVVGAMKNYLFASIITMAMQQVNVFVDGIIVGRLISPDALSATNLYTPINMAVFAIITFFVNGACMLLARYMGERNHDMVERTLSAIVVPVLLSTVVLFLIAWLWGDSITALLCSDANIAGYFHDYMVIALGSSGIFMIYSLLSQLVQINGYPKFITFITTLTAAVNLVFDYVLIAAFGMGVEGSALATIIANSIGVALLLWKAYPDFGKVLMHPLRKFTFVELKANMRQGTPLLTANMVMALMYMCLNSIILAHEGSNGMFALSIFMNVMTLSMMCSRGVGVVVCSMGAFLLGQGDWQGFGIIVRRSILILMTALVVLVSVIVMFPEAFVNLFGCESAELYVYSNTALRFAAWLLLPILLLYYFGSQFQVQGHLRMTMAFGFALPVILIPSLLAWSTVDKEFAIWYAFPQTSLLSILFIVAATEFVRRKNKNLTFITLMPKGESVTTYDTSVRIGNDTDFELSLRGIVSYLEDMDINPTLSHKVTLCVEELLLNIMQHAPRRLGNDFVDIHITRNGGILLASLKDASTPFDPTLCPEQNLGMGLKLVNGMCQHFEYKYMYGQNVTFLTWDISSLTS